jgi:hypothetical protein
MEPEVSYPLMATLSDKKDIDAIDRVIIRAKCSALGLNEHFPRAILHGPMELGGMALPTCLSKTVTTRINYFLYHIRTSTKIGSKLDASIVFLQLETGLFHSFFQISYDTYGFLAAKTLTKQIWAETEPYGIHLKHNADQTWLPTPQGAGDIAIMELVCQHYNKKDACRINRYRLYLRVISIYDLFTYDGKQIHPELARGQRASSRVSTIHWVDFPKPPRKDNTLWISFLNTHIKPLTTTISLSWNHSSTPTYRTTFMKSNTTDKLYQLTTQGLLQFEPKLTKRRSQYQSFHKDHIEIDINDTLLESLTSVEVHCRSSDIQILCESHINSHNARPTDIDTDTDLHSLYSRLLISLKRLCGSVTLPKDGGTKLMQYLLTNNKPLLGASDASLKHGNSSHAWILTTGELEHINDPLMTLSGGGPVDGYQADMSSTRGEIHGQTALAIMSQNLLKAHNQ